MVGGEKQGKHAAARTDDGEGIEKEEGMKRDE